MKRHVVPVLVLAVSTGCAGARRAVVATPAAVAREGVTTVRTLGEVAPGPVEGDVEKITPAFASADNALPEYPGGALEAGCGEGVVPVRLVIGPDGNVAEVGQVPGRPLAGDACHAAFRDATEAAVRTWRFAPAFRLTPGPGPDIDGDGRPDITAWEQVAVAIHVDLEFGFRVLEGRGLVVSR